MFACSHGGEVACVDGRTGDAVWRAILPGRCDAGLAILHDLRCASTAHVQCKRGAQLVHSPRHLLILLQSIVRLRGTLINTFFVVSHCRHRSRRRRWRSAKSACFSCRPPVQCHRVFNQSRLPRSHLAVTCGDGRLHFLSTADGSLAGCCDAGGQVRAAPAIDPWRGRVWLPSHGRRLTVCEPPGESRNSCMPCMGEFTSRW